jgi:hypothetical protein
MTRRSLLQTGFPDRPARRAGLMALWLCLAPALSHANALTIEIRPTADLRAMVACTVLLSQGEFRVIEVQGQVNPIRAPFRWAATPADQRVMLTALQSFLSADLAPIDPATYRTPAPPSVSVTWLADMAGGVQGGFYLQSGLDLPDVLDAVIQTLLTDGPCARLIPSG